MKTPLLLAFSGGLDTTYCVLKLQQDGYDVHTITINTGGFPDEELIEIAEKSAALGAVSHTVLDATTRLYKTLITPLIWANYLKGGNYPACVGAERVVTAIMVAEHALANNINTIAHGSTGAGNDQVRFDVALRAMMPNVKIITPIRKRDLSREQSTAFLAEHGVTIDAKTTKYSINTGVLGTTIGGGETHNAEQNLPKEAFPTVAAVGIYTPQKLALTFAKGVPTALNGTAMAGIEILQQLNAMGAAAGFGAGHHIGTTILGLKGRIGFEAPGMQLILLAKKELEKITLTSQQQFWKSTLGQLYGDFIHEGKYFEPLRADLEALLKSTCQHVCGTVDITLQHGNATVTSMASDMNLLAAQGGMYGESTTAWTGQHAEGFCRLYGYEGVLATQVHNNQ